MTMKRRNCRFFGQMMIIGMLIISFSLSASAADIDILACPEGCTTLAISMYLSREIQKSDPEFHLNPKATEGYLYNLAEMGRNSALWKTTVFGINDDVLIFAPQGGKEPFTKFFPQVNAKFRFLYGILWEVTGHYFITTDPKLKTYSDFKGKKLGLGLVTQSDWGMNPTLDLKYGYNISHENAELFYPGPAKLGKALLNGEVDAIVAGLGAEPNFKSWLPSLILSELEKSDKALYYIGQEAAAGEKINESLKTSYIPITIPAGTLPRQPRPLNTLVDGNYHACHESFPEDLAYKLVKFVAKIGPKARLEAGIWQTWSPEMMVAGLSEDNTHPGAIRAYKELGWWELIKKFKPANLPK